MPRVFRIVYCEFSSAHIEEELTYYTDLMGASIVLKTSDGVHYLSLGLEHHNIVLRPGTNSGLVCTGFQLSTGETVENIAKGFNYLGLACKIKENARPGVPKLLEISVAGHTFEFFTEMEIPAPGFSGHGVMPNRIGHVALLTPEADTLVKFFREALEFHTTDWFESLATFLTCNYDHHVMNIINAPITKIHHIAFELRHGAHQYDASDMLAKANKPIVWGPSRHTAGHNYASYHFDPERILIELYTDMDVYLPDLGYFEPRPWHGSLPQRPQIWLSTDMNAWKTDFDFDFRTA